MASLLNKLRYKLFPPEFTVQIRNGEARKTQGKLRAAVVNDFSAIAEANGISTLTIYGIRHGSSNRLAFDRAVSPSHRQRFRNALNFHR